MSDAGIPTEQPTGDEIKQPTPEKGHVPVVDLFRVASQRFRGRITDLVRLSRDTQTAKSERHETQVPIPAVDLSQDMAELSALQEQHHQLDNETAVALGITQETTKDTSNTETVEITNKKLYIDEIPVDRIFIDRPIATKTFLRTFQKDDSTEPPKPTELPVYAEFAFTIPQSGKDGAKSPLKCAIIGSPTQVDAPSEDRAKQFRLAIYTEDTPGIAQVPRELIDLKNSRAKDISDDKFAGEMEITRHEDWFRIKQVSNEGSIQAVVPPQEELRYVNQAKIDLKQFSEEFPDDIDFDIKFRQGSYEIKDPEQFYSDLEDEVKGAWVVLSKGLGIDIHKFPLETVDFWAQPRWETKGLAGRDKAKEFIYRRRHYPRNFNPRHLRTQAFATPSGLLTREKLNIPVSEGGVVDGENLVHELLHNYMDMEGVDASQQGKGYGQFINEGIGTIGNHLPEKVVTGRMPEYDDVDGMFDEMKAIANGSIKGRVRERSEATTHNPANTMLHWYLLTERGGIDKLRELTQQASRFGTGFNRQRFLNAYQSTYGESFTELLDKSKQWYKDQLALAS